MDTPPIVPLPTPTAPSTAECAADAADPANAAPEGGFQALLGRSIAGLARDATDAGAARPETPGEETPVAADDTALATVAEGVLTASESALALLAALPQQAARSEPTPLGASPGAGISDSGSAGGIDDLAGAGNAPALRLDGAAMPGKGIAHRPGEAGPLSAASPEGIAEAVLGNAGAIVDSNAVSAQQPVHAAAQAAYSPAQPATADPAAPAPAPATPARIDTPLGAPGWSTALADQLVVFAGEKRQVAELRINPPHLGPVDITLIVSDDQASAVFASPHAVVRETIESALPRLREALAESGINLGQASVTADSPRDGSAKAQSRSSFARGGERSGADAAHLTGAARTPVGRGVNGLVDLFA
jgi:flagellar hook-length control protein FliK